MKKFLLLASLLFIMVNAVSVSISTNNYREYRGFLHAMYCMNAALRTSTNPNPNTTNCRANIANGQSTLQSGQTAYIFSPLFTQSYTIPSGAVLAVEMWVASSGGAGGTFSISVSIVNSAGSVLQNIGSTTSPTFGTSPTEWHTTFTLSSAVSIPQGSYIRITLTASQGNTNFIIYRGNSANQRPTNFQLPLVTLTA